MKVLVSGSDGQLGSEVVELLKERDSNFFEANKEVLDITNINKVKEIFVREKPDVIFHCAAYTAVDLAEEEENELNYLINYKGTKNIAIAAKDINATVVYISTDYVFDGLGEENGYKENSRLEPINEYGKAKLLGEQSIEEILSDYYIIRTSWVFGKYGKNFVDTMLRFSESKDQLTVVNNQIGRPTWTRSLAEFMFYLIDNKCDYGVYHFSNDDTCSWYDFATEILKDKEVKVLPVTSLEFQQKAKRPEYSVMNLDKAKSTGFDIVSWKQALKKFMEGL